MIASWAASDPERLPGAITNCPAAWLTLTTPPPSDSAPLAIVSRTVPAACSTVTSAESVCPSTASVRPVPATRTLVGVRPIATAPVNVTPGTLSATSTASDPVMPAVATVKSAVPFWVAVNSVPPSASVTCSAWMRMTPAVWVTAKSPLRVWPRIVSATPVPATCTYGPCGSESVCGAAPTWNVASTAAAVVFTRTASVPLSETPGRAIATVPCTWPASPRLVSRNAALPLLTLTTPPSESATLLARDLDRRGVVAAARDLVRAEVGGLLEGEVAGQPLAEHVDGEAGALEAQVRAGGQVADGAEGRVDRERERAGERHRGWEGERDLAAEPAREPGAGEGEGPVCRRPA